MSKYKRYDMRTEFNKYCSEEQVNAYESKDGLWVKYSDIAELAKAKAEGRLLVLPIALGTEVWCIKEIWSSMAREVERSIVKRKFEFYFYAEGIHYYTSREAAEEALKQMQQQDKP
ncbi:MAG: hypothetical protein WA125_16675 [Desulfosporosinus sp.]